MIPVLYDKYETDFLSNGLGQLGDCLSCVVTEEINGIYEVEFTYPMSGAYYEQLINYGGVLAVTHDHNGDVQLFDIYKYDAPIDGVVTFYGSHVSYRLGNYVWKPYIVVPNNQITLDGIFDALTNGNSLNPGGVPGVALYIPSPHFTFHNETLYDDTGGNLRHTPGLFVVRDAMLNTEENTYGGKGVYANASIMQQWKGEWKYDKFDVYYYNKRGIDRGVQIRYGKNMEGVERSRDASNIVSVLLCYHEQQDPYDFKFYNPVYSTKFETDVSPWYANGGQVFSHGEPMFFNPPVIHASIMDLSDVFETQPTQSEVDSYCRTYMSKNSTWRADDNITIDFLDLYDTPEYENIRGLADCRLGDYVSILYPQLGIVSSGVEIMSLTYDVLAERVIEMQLNTIRTTLAQVILDSIGGK